MLENGLFQVRKWFKTLKNFNLELHTRIRQDKINNENKNVRLFWEALKSLFNSGIIKNTSKFENKKVRLFIKALKSFV